MIGRFATRSEATAASPWILCAVALVGWTTWGGVHAGELAAYLLVLVTCFTWPGAWAWNRFVARSERETLLGLVTFGTVLGLCGQLPVYLVGRAVGLVWLPVLTPIVVTLLAVRDHHRRARAGAGEERCPGWARTPASLAWAVALGTSYAMSWLAGIAWLIWPVPRHDPAAPNGDEPYQVALITELRHHVPPQIPTVAGEPLDYHWFVNAHLASMSWLTGISPPVLLDRLWLPTTTFLVIAATASVAHRLGRSARAGVFAVVLLVLVGNFSPLRWPDAISAFDELFLSFWEPLSPSLGFGWIVMLTAVDLTLRLFSGERSATLVGVLGLVVVVAAGAKATVLPMLVCGALAALVASSGWVRDRLGQEVDRDGADPVPVKAAAVVLVLVLGGLAFAQVVLFRGASQGMWVQPLHLAQPVAERLGWHPHGPGLLGAAVLLLVSWLPAWVGMLGLGRRLVTSPRFVFVAAAAVSGLGASLLLGHPHGSEDYFARGASPLLAIVASCGLVSLIERHRWPRSLWLAPVSGFIIVPLVRWLLPVTPVAGRRLAVLRVLGPYLLTIVLVGAVSGVMVVLLGREHRGSGEAIAQRVRVAVAMLLVVSSLGLVRVAETVSTLAGRPWQHEAAPRAATAPVPAGALAAARWIRSHTSPDDLLATNAHTRTPGSTDNRGAWIAAYAERRVLVEGWAYTPEVFAVAARDHVSTHHLGFHDQALLKANDRAFTHPSAATVGFLVKGHGVRYLVVDRRYPIDLPGLQRVARPVFAQADVSVFTPR